MWVVLFMLVVWLIAAQPRLWRALSDSAGSVVGLLVGACLLAGLAGVAWQFFAYGAFTLGME